MLAYTKWVRECLSVLVLTALVLGFPSGQAQEPQCSVTISPPQSIVQGLAQVPEGGVLCLSEGAFIIRETIPITTSLTLRGKGPRLTRLITNYFFHDIEVESKSPITVTLQGFSISPDLHSTEYFGVGIGGQARVLMDQVLIRGEYVGITIKGQAELTLRRSTLFYNNRAVDLYDDATLTIADSQILENLTGLQVEGGRVLRLEGVVNFFGNYGCAIHMSVTTVRVEEAPQPMWANGADLCGYAPAVLRQPLVPQTDRTEIVVSDEYYSLQEAIDAIAPGGTITLRSPVEESITIWKPLKIRSDPALDFPQFIVPGRGRLIIASITAEARGVELEDLELFGNATEEAPRHMDRGFLREALRIWGQATFRNVTILAEGLLFALRVGGEGRLIMRGGKIQGGTSCDGCVIVTIEDSAGATFEGVKITSDLEGALIGWHPSLGDSHGIWVRDRGRLVLLRSEVTRVGREGIVLEGKAQALLRENKIHDNGRWGVALFAEPCFPDRPEFTGIVEGANNEIINNGADLLKEELQQGDGEGNVCPKELTSLKK